MEATVTVSVRMLPAGSAARRKARRFWGTMGAAMTQTSRWLDERSVIRADAALRRAEIRLGVRFGGL
jgi:hypothetical protein